MDHLKGDALRRAASLLADLRKERPGTPLIQLIDEASRRANLDPAESETFLRLVMEGAGHPPPQA